MKTKYNSLFMYTFLILLPVEFTPGSTDSSETTIKFVHGSGQYGIISRGCEGEVLEKEKRKFTEIGGQIDHTFSRSPVRIGLRGEYVSFKYPTYNMTEIENAFIINPFISFEGRKVAIGGGVVWSTNPLPGRSFEPLDPKGSFFFRYGDLRKGYITISRLHSVPFFADGFTQFGFGVRSSNKVNIWFGGSAGPYDHLGFLAKIDIRLVPQTYLHLSGRIGQSADIRESALGVGISYRLRK